MSSRHDQLTVLIEPVVKALGCVLWGLEYLSQGRRVTLRVYIDKEGGVNLDDCEKVSRQISSVLDVEDPIQGQYALEVSSPGVDRPLYTLAQFSRYVGERVNIRLRVPFEGRRKFTGTLSGVEDNDVLVVVDEHEYLLPVETIEKANIIPRF
ncbi:MAG: ribosome maturation factor RimP [Exilibacterium sp.]